MPLRRRAADAEDARLLLQRDRGQHQRRDGHRGRGMRSAAREQRGRGRRRQRDRQHRACSAPSHESRKVTATAPSGRAQQVREVERPALSRCSANTIESAVPASRNGTQRRGEVERQAVGVEREAHDRATGDAGWPRRRAASAAPPCRATARRGARSACSANPPRPQPSSATEMATNAKWYQMVAEKIRVSPISNMRPESVMRKTAACMAIWAGDITLPGREGQIRPGPARIRASVNRPSRPCVVAALLLSACTRRAEGPSGTRRPDRLRRAGRRDHDARARRVPAAPSGAADRRHPGGHGRDAGPHPGRAGEPDRGPAVGRRARELRGQRRPVRADRLDGARPLRRGRPVRALASVHHERDPPGREHRAPARAAAHVVRWSSRTRAGGGSAGSRSRTRPARAPGTPSSPRWRHSTAGTTSRPCCGTAA